MYEDRRAQLMGDLHMRFVAWGILGLLCLAGSAGAQEDATVKAFVRYAQANDRFRDVVAAAGRGLEAANSELERRGQPKLYCQPDHMAITPDQYVSFLANYTERNPQAGTMQAAFYSLVLLYAMVDVLPCK
ncbi:hypothetical protein PY650_30905 [Rhizobium calliandrae]|uniref:Rap1a immunity protein domain-containing protein n=1 Tax=Rhizobium calliandrae TaxID=1312182 RepID=A0ABT7KMS9_9HYPH|nr:hypothetical protein [Rhizobium calliandrae]MDL2409949.1 hypothetical protein [Rhizobium calliandrae]